MEGLRFRGRILLSGHGFRSCVQRFHQLSRRPPSEWARSLFFSTTRQTARNAGDYEDAATDFLEKTYADRSGASSGLSTTYGILSFVGLGLSHCRCQDWWTARTLWAAKSAQEVEASRCQRGVSAPPTVSASSAETVRACPPSLRKSRRVSSRLSDRCNKKTARLSVL